MLDSITVKKNYPYPIDSVWNALTDPEALAAWFLPNDFVPEIGHTFTFKDKPAPGFDGNIHCQVLALEAPTLLAYSWKGGSIDTEVIFNLSSTPTGGTLLRLEHRGFSGMVNKLFIRNLLAAGWRYRLLAKQLPQYLQYA